MERYENAKIVKISSPNTDKVSYFGTVSKDVNFVARHVNARYAKWCLLEGDERQKKHKPEFTIVEAGDAEVEIFSECPCGSKRELDTLVEEASLKDPKSIMHKSENFVSVRDRDLVAAARVQQRGLIRYVNNREKIIDQNMKLWREKQAQKEEEYKKKIENGENVVRRGKGRPRKIIKASDKK